MSTPTLNASREEAIKTRLNEIMSLAEQKKEFYIENQHLFEQYRNFGKRIVELRKEVMKMMQESDTNQVVLDTHVLHLKEKFRVTHKKDELDNLLDMEGDELENEFKSYVFRNTKRNDVLSIRKV